MDRFKNVVKRPVFHLFLFGISLAFFGWPFLSIPDPKHGYLVFFYLFITWAVVIAILYYMARNLPEPRTEDAGNEEAEF